MHIIIAGRTRTGKDTLKKHLSQEYNMSTLKTHTDRPRRFPEENGYIFHTKEESAAIPYSEKWLLTRGVDGHDRWTTIKDFLDSGICILDTSGIPMACQAAHRHGHRVILIYAITNPMTAEQKDIELSIQNGKTIEEAKAILANRKATEDKQFSHLEAQLNRDVPGGISGVPLEPTIFTPDLCILWHNHYREKDLSFLCGILEESFMAKPVLRQNGGYFSYTEKEPLILDSEDWTKEKWDVICELFGTDPATTCRIMSHSSRTDLYICPRGVDTEDSNISEEKA